jgi:hypothetical protein
MSAADDQKTEELLANLFGGAPGDFRRPPGSLSFLVVSGDDGSEFTPIDGDPFVHALKKGDAAISLYKLHHRQIEAGVEMDPASIAAAKRETLAALVASHPNPPESLLRANRQAEKAASLGARYSGNPTAAGLFAAFDFIAGDGATARLLAAIEAPDADLCGKCEPEKLLSDQVRAFAQTVDYIADQISEDCEDDAESLVDLGGELRDAAEHVEDLEAALKLIALVRDYCAETGEYPRETVDPEQGFDDWAADVATSALGEGFVLPNAVDYFTS